MLILGPCNLSALQLVVDLPPAPCSRKEDAYAKPPLPLARAVVMSCSRLSAGDVAVLITENSIPSPSPPKLRLVNGVLAKPHATRILTR